MFLTSDLVLAQVPAPANFEVISFNTRRFFSILPISFDFEDLFVTCAHIS